MTRMKSGIAAIVLVLGMISMTWASTTDLSSLPKSPGVYYQDATKQWLKLNRVKAAKTDYRQGFGQMLTGLGALKYKMLYQNGAAQAQIADVKPTFYLRVDSMLSKDIIDNLPNLVIGKFSEVKKKERKLVYSSVTATSQKRGDTLSVDMERISDDIIAITPQASLEPGEYLIHFTLPEEGFDFGVLTTTANAQVK